MCDLTCPYLVATLASWYESTPQPLLKVRYVGGVNVSRLQQRAPKLQLKLQWISKLDVEKLVIHLCVRVCLRVCIATPRLRFNGECHSLQVCVGYLIKEYGQVNPATIDLGCVMLSPDFLEGWKVVTEV